MPTTYANYNLAWWRPRAKLRGKAGIETGSSFMSNESLKGHSESALRHGKGIRLSSRQPRIVFGIPSTNA
jgi:hypothetical protein